MEYTDAQLARIRRNEEYAHQFADKHMRKWGLIDAGWKFEVASFYEEKNASEVNGDLLGHCHRESKRVVLFPCALISKARSRETILHEIAHALSPNDNKHGADFLAACDRVMPDSMAFSEYMTYSEERREKP
jgi:hypothetical protein